MPRPDLFMQERREQTDTRLAFPNAPFPHAIQFIFKKYDYNEYVTNSRTGNLNSDGDGSESTQWANAKARRVAALEKESTVIELPMPQNLTDATGMQVGGFERSMLEAFIGERAGALMAEGGIGALSDALQGLGSKAASLISNNDGERAAFGKSLGVTGDTIKKVFAAIGKQALSSVAGEKNMAAVTGTATNPQETLFFSGVDLRSYQFDFKLFPESPEEAETIRKIIRTIKRQTLPTVRDMTNGNETIAEFGGSAFTKAYLEYPAIVLINLLGIDERHFTKYKPCMIKSFDVSYSSTIAEGGVPAQVDIQISLQEIEIQTAEDYGAGDTTQGSTDGGSN